MQCKMINGEIHIVTCNNMLGGSTKEKIDELNNKLKNGFGVLRQKQLKYPA